MNAESNDITCMAEPRQQKGQNTNYERFSYNEVKSCVRFNFLRITNWPAIYTVSQKTVQIVFVISSSNVYQIW